MMRQRYPIFCSVFPDAFDESGLSNSFLPQTLQSLEDTEPLFQPSTIDTDYFPYSDGSTQIDLTDDSYYQPKQQQELDFSHDLDQVASLIEHMVISLGTQQST